MGSCCNAKRNRKNLELKMAREKSRDKAREVTLPCQELCIFLSSLFALHLNSFSLSYKMLRDTVSYRLSFALRLNSFLSYARKLIVTLLSFQFS